MISISKVHYPLTLSVKEEIADLTSSLSIIHPSLDTVRLPNLQALKYDCKNCLSLLLEILFLSQPLLNNDQFYRKEIVSLK